MHDEIAALHRKTVLNELADEVHVYIAAAENGDGAFASQIEPPAQQCRHTRGARALHEQLTALQQQQHGVDNLLVVYRDHLVYERTHDLERIAPGHLRGDAVGYRVDVRQRDNGAGIQRGAHRSGARGLNADDAYVGFQRLHRRGDTGDEAAAADTHDESLYLR